MIRHGYRAIQQVCNRIHERSFICDHTIEIRNIKKDPVIKKEKRLDLGTFVLDSTQMHNSWFLTYDSKIVHMKSVFLENNIIYINGSSLKHTDNFFERPINSSILNIYSSNCEENNPTRYTLNQIKCKLVAVKYKNNITVFLPLLHTL